MATLTETAYFARKGVNIFIILLVAIVILRVVLNIATGVWQKAFPAKLCPATVAFGKLPYPNGQNAMATPSGISYSLETTGGGLPTLPGNLRVYFLTPTNSSFRSFDRMKVLAAKLGFSSDPKKIGPTLWHFVDSDNSLRILDIDEITQNFHLSYNFGSDLSLFNEKNFSTEEKIISDAQNFFDGLGDLPSELKNGQGKVVYLKIDSGSLVATTSLSNADAVAVSLARAEISEKSAVDGGGLGGSGCVLPVLDKAPIVSADSKMGLVSVLFSGNSDQKKKIVEAKYFYAPLDLENWATYPTIKATEAFEKLKQGKAFFASLPAPMPKNITIASVSLAYLDPYPPQAYLQPVVVFSDGKGFTAYVPAVDRAWLQQ